MCMTGNMSGNPATHFGRQVRKERTARGWSVHEMSKRSGISAGHISRLENGTRTPTERIAERLDEVFPERDGWFSEYHRDSQAWTPPGYRHWQEYEDKAATLRCWVGGVIHGLAQTPEYARAHLATTDAPTEVVSARLQARMERQARLLRRDTRAEVWFLVDELALYREMGSPEIMAGQCDHLVKLGTAPDVSVLVVPAMGHPGANAEITVTDSAVYTEHFLSGYTYTDADAVATLTRKIVRLQGESYRASESAGIIGEVGELWRTGVSPVLALRKAGRASK